MSEQYPTQAEYQEALNEIFAHDPDLYDYIVHGEYEEPAELDFNALEERLYLMEAFDDDPTCSAYARELDQVVMLFQGGSITKEEAVTMMHDTNHHGHESREEAYRKRFGL